MAHGWFVIKYILIILKTTLLVLVLTLSVDDSVLKRYNMLINYAYYKYLRVVDIALLLEGLVAIAKQLGYSHGLMRRIIQIKLFQFKMDLMNN